MRTVRFVKCTIEQREDHPCVYFSTEDKSTILMEVTKESRPTIQSYLNDMYTGQTSMLEEDNRSIAEKLLEKSQEYLQKSMEEKEDPDRILFTRASEEFLFLAMLVERYQKWGIPLRPLLEAAAKRNRGYDDATYSAIDYCLLLLAK